MNKAITDGVQLMPPAFANGLGVWSSGDGVPGSDTYASSANAAFVPADQDFGGCLELLKTDATQKLRYMGQTPLLPGCYLRVTAKVKAISGNLPTVRIAGWAGGAGDTHVTGLTEVGPSKALSSYGDVVEVSAIIGAGQRNGVDMVWGTAPLYGHFGLNLTGQNGGVVRIDDIVIEDVTEVFHRDMMNWVDVRDYGAVGDGVTDDAAAFEAADSAADGRRVLVSKGTYFLGSSVTIESRIQFEGTVTMPDAAILSLTKEFHLPSYIDAFGNEELAFKKAFQSLLNNSDHESLDLGGRRVSLTGPIDLHAVVGNHDSYAQRRVIQNGQLKAEDNVAWDPDVFTSQATYSTSNAFRLTNVANVANIPVGAHVTGSGVGREVYVRAVDVAAGEVSLSQPLYDAVGTQNYTFTRYKYMLDFSGFSKITFFSLANLELQCSNRSSGVCLAPLGSVFQIRDCFINRPRNRGVTSIGDGCQGMLIDRTQFNSPENGLLAQDRQVIAVTANANDVKLRNNRATQFRHFAVLSGTNSIISGNHFFQGDSANNGPGTAGIVIALRSCNTSISGNYVDNCFIEWTNERETSPDFSGGFGFAGMTISNNVFLAGGMASWFSFIVVKPYGTGQFVNGLNVAGNTFRGVGSVINRVERVDTSFAPLDLGRMGKVFFRGNTFHNVSAGAINPLTLEHTQSSTANTWTVDFAGKLPFEGYTQKVEGVVARGAIVNGSNQAQFVMPYIKSEQGPQNDQVTVNWPSAVRGTVGVTVRMDN